MTIDKLEGKEKIKALIRGVLSGNMFDWGAQAVATLMETTDFGFTEAQEKIPGTLRYVATIDNVNYHTFNYS